MHKSKHDNRNPKRLPKHKYSRKNPNNGMGSKETIASYRPKR